LLSPQESGGALRQPATVMRSVLSRWRPTLLTLLLGLGAALLCEWLRTPLPWMIGPLLAVAAARMMGADLRAPSQARNAGQWAI
ncbi:AbrB family transcriptional regulator, partial [Acinetobacter baumannii]